jgi:hypothetical protein
MGPALKLSARDVGGHRSALATVELRALYGLVSDEDIFGDLASGGTLDRDF